MLHRSQESVSLQTDTSDETLIQVQAESAAEHIVSQDRTPELTDHAQQLGSTAMRRQYTRSWTLEQLSDILDSGTVTSLRQIAMMLNLSESGRNNERIKRAIESLGLSIEPYTNFKRPVQERLIDYTGLTDKEPPQSGHIRQLLIAKGLKPRHCECCGWGKVTPDNRLPLELHHLDGNPLNYKLSNLKVLCPCCHAFAPNHCKKMPAGSFPDLFSEEACSITEPD